MNADDSDRQLAIEALQTEVGERRQGTETVADLVLSAVAEALMLGQFDAQLRQQGLVLVAAARDEPPSSPNDWAENALNLALPGWIDPLSLIEQLWQEAWTAGVRAERARAERARAGVAPTSSSEGADS